MQLWIQYKNTAQTSGTPVTNNMEQEDIDEMGNTQTKLLEYTQVNAVDFIKGDKDISDDAAWDDWCRTQEKYNYQKVLDIMQPYADKYEIL